LAIERNARKLAKVMYDAPDGATYDGLLKRSWMAEPIFGPAFNYAKERGWFTEGRSFAENDKYYFGDYTPPSSPSPPTSEPQPANVEGSELLKQAMKEMDEETKAKPKP
jgi:hypothetical protein